MPSTVSFHPSHFISRGQGREERGHYGGVISLTPTPGKLQDASNRFAHSPGEQNAVLSRRLHTEPVSDPGATWSADEVNEERRRRGWCVRRRGQRCDWSAAWMALAREVPQRCGKLRGRDKGHQGPYPPAQGYSIQYRVTWHNCSLRGHQMALHAVWIMGGYTCPQ